MINSVVTSNPRFSILGLCFLFALSACGGDGSGNGADASEGVLPPGDETPFTVNTNVEGEAVPGQIVRLIAGGSAESAIDVQWRQTDGPPVTLENDADARAQFRVPPVAGNTSFGFQVDVTDPDGISHRHHLQVVCEGLSWKDLEVVEAELADDFVMFRANKDNSLRVDLFRADLDGNNIVRLNGPLAPGGNVDSFSISPDGTTVAYLADEDTVGVFELFVVASIGGNAARVSGDLTTGGNVTRDFLWSPDSSRVAYRADQNSDEKFELFAALRDGGAAERLSGDMTANGDVVEANFFWSSDSRRIAYRANQFNDNTLELFVSSRIGTGNWRVSTPPVVGGGVLGNFAWMPGGRQLAYVADQQAVSAFELFVVNDDGSGNVKVSGPLVSDGSVLDFSWSPSGNRIAYRAEQLADTVVELFSALPDGSDNTLISALSATGGDVAAYAWAPDGSAIAYLADQDTGDVVELFAAGPDGIGNRRLSGPLTGNGDVTEFAWAPDSSYVAYRADQVNNGVPELFTSTPDGAVNLKISGTPVMGGRVFDDWRWSGDSRWLVYRADQRIDQVLELYSATPDGAANLLISGGMTAGGNVESLEGRAFQWSPDSSRIVYAADQQENDKYELYVTAPDSGIAITSISGTITSGGDVRNFALASRPGELAQSQGVLTNVPLNEQSGWEECWRSSYGTDGEPIADILATCDRAHLMMACRPVGATTLTVAAWAPRTAVTTDTGRGNMTTNANGVEWYFNDSYSWGFASGGDTVNRSSCDTDNDNPELRLCWHTNAGSTQGGWRCGASTNLFDDTWERLLFHRDVP